jgi:hypothetical protein
MCGFVGGYLYIWVKWFFVKSTMNVIWPGARFFLNMLGGMFKFLGNRFSSSIENNEDEGYESDHDNNYY